MKSAESFKILIVDDTRSVHAFIKSQLGNFASLSMTSVMNGEEAVRAVRNDLFQLVLLDWEMPVRNGPDTLVLLRKMDKELAVVMMTTHNDPRAISAVIEQGARDFLIKPFSREQLLQKVESLTGRRLHHAA